MGRQPQLRGSAPWLVPPVAWGAAVPLVSVSLGKLDQDAASPRPKNPPTSPSPPSLPCSELQRAQVSVDDSP